MANGLGFLRCQAVKASSLTVATMYSTQKNLITILIHAYMWHKMAKVSTLLDSGATKNFIDKQTIKTLGLGTRPLLTPLNIHNVDSTLNQEGQITQYCDLWVQQGRQTEKLRFYATNLGKDRLILGHPWFCRFNPDINWPNNSERGPSLH